MSKPQFNKTKIEWTAWTWNPMTGCNHGCSYCYAPGIRARFFHDHDFLPTFYHRQLDAPKFSRVPEKLAGTPGIERVFVCSMSDLFGAWWPAEQIQAVLDACAAAPQWTFILLTKNPRRYLEFAIPGNCWCGATADRQRRADVALEVFKKMPDEAVRFLSCEPLLEPVALGAVPPVDLVIIGGQSKTARCPHAQPAWEWVENLVAEARTAGAGIFFKKNLTCRPAGYPNLQESPTVRREVAP